MLRKVHINYLIVGHTHEDIDAMFGRWNWRLKANNYPMLIKLFMNVEKQLVILQLFEKVPNFKAFIDGYLYSGNDALQGHTNIQQFKFYKIVMDGY